MYIRYNITKILLFLSILAAFVIVTNLGVIVLKYNFGFNHDTIFYEFVLDDEENIPSFFSSTILLIASIALLIISLFQRMERSGDYKYWLGLCLVFLFLAIDESAALHESIIKFFWQIYEPSDYDNYVWPLTYGLLVAILAAIYWKFIFTLPKKICYLIIISGVLYVGGAIGFEAIGSSYIGVSWFQPIEWDSYADEVYYLIATIEESAEILGVLTFIFALLSYIEIKWQGLYLFVGRAPAESEERTLPQ